MPELPEVETVCRGLHRFLTGQRIDRVIVRRRDLRQPIPADFERQVAGRVVERVGRRAKYLLLYLDDGGVVLGHLGMSGRMQLHRSPLPPPASHDHVIFAVRPRPAQPQSDFQVVYHDPRRFGLLLLTSQPLLADHPLLRKLGPEPLEPLFTADRLRQGLGDRRGSLKSALLDQTVVAGLGNIYVSEALFRAKLAPDRPAGQLSSVEAGRLCRAIREVLGAAIAAGGSSISDYVQADGELGSFQDQFQVYDRGDSACPRRGCRGQIVRIVQSGRATFYCPHCQQ